MYKLTLFASNSAGHHKVGLDQPSGMHSSPNQPEMTQIIPNFKTTNKLLIIKN